MAKSKQRPGATPQESRVHRFEGVQLYGRKGPDGRFSHLDAIDTDGEKIQAIADLLQRRGFGVMRHREARAGKVLYLCRATWAGFGEPPEHPFDDHREALP